MKKLFYYLAAAVALASCSGSKDDGPSEDPSKDGQPDVKVEIRMEGSEAAFSTEISHSVRVREYANIEVQITPADAAAKITYETDDINIARVSRNGTITGRNEGKTDIKVLADGAVKAVCHLTVEEYEAVVTEFNLDVSEVEMEWGSTMRTVVKKISPSAISVGDTRFEFSSSDESIFTVENDEDGFGCKITGEHPGEGTLHVEVKSATLDIPVVITKKRVGLESWRFEGPFNNMEPQVFHKEALTVYYPTFTDVYLFDEVSRKRLDDGYNGKYSVDNNNKETVNAAAFEDCVSLAAKGNGTSDDEGWGSVTLHYENDLVVSDIDLEIEFRGFNGMHGDMTIVEDNPNSDDYGKDLCTQTHSISSKGFIKIRLGRKSGEELKGVYRPNSDREWVKLVTEGLDIVRWDSRTLYLYATVSKDATQCMVLFQGQYGSVKILVVNYTVK
ncbi:MAG: Ig-like domain-containing protein [Bacteroidales bacterium]|nr:Ig-like domain-containing protein [Bacteroidales bacterium]